MIAFPQVTGSISEQLEQVAAVSCQAILDASRPALGPAGRLAECVLCKRLSCPQTMGQQCFAIYRAQTWENDRD